MYKGLKLRQIICLSVYYSVANKLPPSNSTLGRIFLNKKIRYFLCKNIFLKCGRNVNVEKGAFFGTGESLVIGDNSGLGINCHVPKDLIVGNDVMMGPNCWILSQNHNFSRTDIPIRLQGYKKKEKPTIIDDDVWIGRDVTCTVGCHIATGSVIAACTCLCKDFPPYSVIGGNPSRLIKTRNDYELQKDN